MWLLANTIDSTGPVAGDGDGDRSGSGDVVAAGWEALGAGWDALASGDELAVKVTAGEGVPVPKATWAGGVGVAGDGDAPAPGAPAPGNSITAATSAPPPPSTASPAAASAVRLLQPVLFRAPPAPVDARAEMPVAGRRPESSPLPAAGPSPDGLGALP